eukprot:CAMPEP_0201479766 /NCGR_PEP_ID=MMETSP0151_2-20130828/4418_1 /ASSEMBLY_ACC=CAM_ASM_000257 /TAXON_ID=200890 /ORGANISM="Paramoeba atlantica, Strain 621/1 / CCAP 1560/9" /LENGTH=302 /DNA_ID=CAMNT_0047861419 /DNA_START=38 /DNA_END=946 /DNA_ORIENTATION=+
MSSGRQDLFSIEHPGRVLCGWLFKQAKWRKAWDSREFVLLADGTLAYRRADSDLPAAIFSISPGKTCKMILAIDVLKVVEQHHRLLHQDLSPEQKEGLRKQVRSLNDTDDRLLTLGLTITFKGSQKTEEMKLKFRSCQELIFWVNGLKMTKNRMFTCPEDIERKKFFLRLENDPGPFSQDIPMRQKQQLLKARHSLPPDVLRGMTASSQFQDQRGSKPSFAKSLFEKENLASKPTPSTEEKELQNIQKDQEEREKGEREKGEREKREDERWDELYPECPSFLLDSIVERGNLKASQFLMQNK